METKVNYVFVGMFVLLLVAAMIAGVLWLSAGNQYNKVFDTYVAYMQESVSGLNLNAPVKYRGVNVGKVRQISLDTSSPEQVRIELNIERGTPITIDTIAVLKAQGLTGIAYVELSGGSRDSPLLKPAKDIPYPVIKTGLSLLGRLDMAMTGLLINFNKTTENLNELLDDENRSALKQTLAHLASATGTLAARKADIDKALTNTTLTMENMAKSSSQLPALIERIGNSAAALEKMAKDTTRASASISQTLDGIGPDALRFAEDGLPELERLIVEMRELSVSLQRITRQVEQDPSILLRGKEARQRGPGE
jgi:phospholipid/cholesterol/gamma-HCH transport system substrate-binding protein